MSVLVACPTYRPKERSMQAIRALSGDLFFARANPHSRPDRGRANVLHSYRQGRRLALRGGYSAMLTVEEDMLPPSDALEKLQAVEADVVTGIYRYRSDGSLNVRPLPERREGVTTAQRGGMGCLLIRRKALERIDFRLAPEYDGGDTGGFPDSYFWQDVVKEGFTAKARWDVRCGHIDTDRTLYP